MHQEYEFFRKNGQYDADAIASAYQKHGLIILKNFFSESETKNARATLESYIQYKISNGEFLKFSEYQNADFILGDILSIDRLRNFDFIFFKNELTKILKLCLNDDRLVYWGDSSTQAGEAARGFHKDNVGRYDASHNDWCGDYGLIRCGFYLQDHKSHSGGLKVRKSSHNIPNYKIGKSIDVKSEAGDLLFWSMRMTHSGNAKQFAWLPNFSLHPRVEGILPSWAARPEEMRRISCFCAFGRPGTHLDNYIKNMNRREIDYRPYFEHSLPQKFALEACQNAGVIFQEPNDYYGNKYRSASQL